MYVRKFIGQLVAHEKDTFFHISWYKYYHKPDLHTLIDFGLVGEINVGEMYLSARRLGDEIFVGEKPVAETASSASSRRWRR
jgi:hypothetical protein